MGFLSTFFGILGFGIGISIGLLAGFIIFIFFKSSDDVKDPIMRPLDELDPDKIQDLLPEVPSWIKYSDYERVDWLNKFLSDMWPYLDRAICATIRSVTKPIFEDYIGFCLIKSIEFERLTLGTIPPAIHGVKIYESNDKELVLEPVLKWAGNPNIKLVLKLSCLPITVQLIDLQISLAPRVTLKPLVPTFPCFANIFVSLMEKPDIDFGLKVHGGDLMAIPGLYRYAQETIKKQIARLYIWPQVLKIPIFDCSAGFPKKPVGILHVKVVRALKLLKMDILGTSDPYVRLSLSGDRLPTKKSTVIMKNLNPVWNEEFKLSVKDPESQVLQMHVYDWEKVETHDKLGMQVIPLSALVPQETKSFTLDLVKNLNQNDPQNKKKRGQIVVELTFKPFREELSKFSGPLDGFYRKDNMEEEPVSPENPTLSGAGLLFVFIQGAEDIEGKNHNNPYVRIVFRGEQKKTKTIKRTRDPRWNEEFEFMLDAAPLDDKIHIEVVSRPSAYSFRSKESLGHVDINLADVVYNGRINEKYHLINSQNGLIHVEIRWKTV